MFIDASAFRKSGRRTEVDALTRPGIKPRSLAAFTAFVGFG
jgi:hypothetical protein